MTAHKTSWDKNEFSDFLVKEKGCSSVVGSNYVSRCLRVERVLKVDLQNATKTIDGYIALNSKLCRYAKKNTEDFRSAQILVLTLRSAIKSFVEYKWGLDGKELPRFYGGKVRN